MAITRVNQTNATDSGAKTSTTVTIPAVGAGNCLVVIVASTILSFSSIGSVSGAGATWARGPVANSVGTTFLEIWYGLNATGGSTSVVVNYAGTMNANDVMAIKVLEYSGVATSSAIDQSDGTANSSAGSTSPATNSITNTNANDVIIAAVANGVNTDITTAGPTNSFSALTFNGMAGAGVNVGLNSAERIVAATGTYSTGWTYSGSTPWEASILSLKAAVIAPNPKQIPTIVRKRAKGVQHVVRTVVKGAVPPPGKPPPRETVRKPTRKTGATTRTHTFGGVVATVTYPPRVAVLEPRRKVKQKLEPFTPITPVPPPPTTSHLNWRGFHKRPFWMHKSHNQDGVR